MASAISQSDADVPFSNYPVPFLLPQTFGILHSAGASTVESDDSDYLSNLFNSTEFSNSAVILEHAKAIRDGNGSSFLIQENRANDLTLRNQENQLEMPWKKERIRRPGLHNDERGKHAFDFSANMTPVGASQMGTKVESWPVIDYSCLKHISDPIKYFSTFTMLQNAEKEVKRLKGETSAEFSQPESRRDRQRRPGLCNLEGKKREYNFPAMTATLEDSQMESSTQSKRLSIIELTMDPGSLKNIELDKLNGNAEIKDSDIDKETVEFERQLTKCRDFGHGAISKSVMETIRISPIDEKIVNSVNSLSALQPISLINVQERLAKISSLAAIIFQDTSEPELVDDFEDPLSIKRQKMSSLSPVDTINAPVEILEMEAGKLQDDSCPETPVMEEQLEASSKVLKGSNEKDEQPLSEVSLNRELQEEEPHHRERRQKSVLRRKSLAGAGSKWDAGVRRSSRIRFKPLQHWCGERLLYGRIHDSLATVIGVKKFETPLPGKRKKTVMKVHSYVPDEYADLVALAALH